MLAPLGSVVVVAAVVLVDITLVPTQRAARAVQVVQRTLNSAPPDWSQVVAEPQGRLLAELAVLARQVVEQTVALAAVAAVATGLAVPVATMVAVVAVVAVVISLLA